MNKTGVTKPTSEEAKEILIAEQKENTNKCAQEIAAVLEKYSMQLQASAIVPANQVNIVPKV